MTQALGKDPQGRQIILWSKITQAVSHSHPPGISPQTQGSWTNTAVIFLFVFKATPTLWQPMAAATPDLLLATAISSQVSVLSPVALETWKVGYFWREVGGPPKENTTHTYIHSGNDLQVLNFKST